MLGQSLLLGHDCVVHIVFLSHQLILKCACIHRSAAVKSRLVLLLHHDLVIGSMQSLFVHSGIVVMSQVRFLDSRNCDRSVNT